MNKNNSFLSVSFSKGFTSPNLPIVTFTQGNKELNFVLDTGSDDNIVSKESLKDIEYTNIEHQGTLAGIGGVYNAKACMITFQLDGEEFTDKFIISDQLKEAFDSIRKAHAVPLHGMIGSKFLIQNNIVLDFNNMIAYNNK